MHIPRPYPSPDQLESLWSGAQESIVFKISPWFFCLTTEIVCVEALSELM